MSDAEVSGNGSIITVEVPLTLRKRGGRKLIVAPVGQEQWASVRPRVDNTLVKAIARAYRWQQMLKQGAYESAEDIAKAKKISASYVNRLPRPGPLADGPIGHAPVPCFSTDWLT
ncbi:hypothetical protein [Mesorhizobium sp.]|uniref:hypothetical protein n=1 Tax=Mesorhizobium sp. TaxID=1871066 RepID=UPI00257F0D04|nr:hypothetical protein [Mesorhizobium sp.]